MFLSAYETAAGQIREAAERRDRLRKTAEPPTPGHSAAAAANEYARDNAEEAEAQRRRARVQHGVDPYLHECPEVDELDCAEMGKRYRQAVDTPDGYPPMRPVDAEQFRRPPVAAGHAANSPAYGPPGQTVPVPSATLVAGAISRPQLTEGRARACAPDAPGR